MTILPERDNAEARRVWWREKRTIAIAAGVAFLLIVVLAWRSCHKTAAASDEAGNIQVSVQVAKAERAPIANEIAMVATLVPIREATISPKIAAPIARMPLLTNRPVHAGDVLAVLESRDVTAQRAEAASAVAEAEASAHATRNGAVPLTNAQDVKSVRDAHAALDNARKTYERRQVLYREGGISKKDLEASQLAVTQAEDDVRLAESSSTLHRGVTNPGDITVAQSKAAQARNHLANLDAQLGYTIIRAPFDGIVTEQWQFQGEFANPGGKMLTIADTTSLIVKMDVAEETASRLKAGDAVTIFPDDSPGAAFPGTITLVGRGADPQSRSVEVWAQVPNPGGRMRANGVARVIIAAQQVASAVVVPTSAITLDATNGSSGTVMVVDAKSIAHEVHVTTGVRTANRTQILTGLNGGETVVVEGNYGLPDGTKVAVPQPDQPKADKAAKEE
jgi:HlyD family secretion protein